MMSSSPQHPECRMRHFPRDSSTHTSSTLSHSKQANNGESFAQRGTLRPEKRPVAAGSGAAIGSGTCTLRAELQASMSHSYLDTWPAARRCITAAAGRATATAQMPSADAPRIQKAGRAGAKTLMWRAGLRPNGVIPARVSHSARGWAPRSTRRGFFGDSGHDTTIFNCREAQPHIVRDLRAVMSRPLDRARPRVGGQEEDQH